MKRTLLFTMLALSLTLGASNTYAQSWFGRASAAAASESGRDALAGLIRWEHIRIPLPILFYRMW